MRTIPTMPTDKPRVPVIFEEEDYALLESLYKELQRPEPTTEHTSWEPTFNQWVARLAMERARQIAAQRGQ